MTIHQYPMKNPACHECRVITFLFVYILIPGCFHVHLASVENPPKPYVKTVLYACNGSMKLLYYWSILKAVNDRGIKSDLCNQKNLTLLTLLFRLI